VSGPPDKRQTRVPGGPQPGLYIPEGAESPSGLWLPLGYADDGASPRTLGMQMSQSGLAIASRRQPDLMDVLFRAIPSEDDVGLSHSSLSDLRAMVAELPFDTAMVLFARLAAEVWHGSSDEDVQLALARDLFPPDALILGRIERFLASEEKAVIFAEQQLFALMRLVIEQSPDGHANEEDPEAFRSFAAPAFRSLFAALSVVTDSIDELPGSDTDRRKWLGVLVQNGGYNAKSPALNAFTRARRLLELSTDPDVGEPQDRCDVTAWLQDDYGLTAEQQFAVAFALMASVGAMSADEEVNARSLLGADRVNAIIDQLGLGDRREQVLDVLSAPRDWYVEQFARGEDTAMDVAWRRTPFEKRPFLRWGDGHLLLLSPRAILSWMGDGFHHRVFACAERRGDAVKNKYSRYYGQLVEAYAVELAQSAYPGRLGTQRVRGEQRYGKGGGAKTSDISIDCAPDLVLFEVAGGRLTEHTRVLASWKAVEFDLKKLVLVRVKKLDTCIEALLDGRARIPDIDAKNVRHIWPVIVTAGDVFQSEMLWDYIEDEAGSRLQQKQVKPLTLLDMDDFELLMGLVDGGASLVDILRRKAESPFRQLDLQQWRANDPTAPAEHRPHVMTERMREVTRALTNQLGIDASDSSA
jgi:hypothetical protein